MLRTTRTEIESLLKSVAEALDIPDELHEDVELKYLQMAEHLSDKESKLTANSLKIYPQGSFRLGTVVKPLTDEDEYDIDLVCELDIQKTSITQADLKKRIGDRLKSDDDLKEKVVESRRCWRINFTEQLHMDVLPAIPNEDNLPTGILLTDKELRHWQTSNPIKYADWFKNRMRIVLLEKRAALAKSLSVDVAELPDWQVKTPLQRVVQLLKRHRDVFFANAPDRRPVSIIITTLAAWAYQNQEDLQPSLLSILTGMEDFIMEKDGKYIVQNPADEDENFADKWNQYPDRRKDFFNWLEKAKADFGTMFASKDLFSAQVKLEQIMGLGIVKRAQIRTDRLQKSLPANPMAVVPDLASTNHCQVPMWPINTSYNADISATLHPLKYSRKNIGVLTGRPTGKNLHIQFRVSTNTPGPFEIKWQVVNSGKEAQDDSCLRGDFISGEAKTPSILWERTGYKGTHWVEAFIIKNGICVARTGKKIVRVR